LAGFFLALVLMGPAGAGAYSQCCQSCLNRGNSYAGCQYQLIQTYSYFPNNQYERYYQEHFWPDPIAYTSNMCSDCPAGWYRSLSQPDCQCYECFTKTSLRCDFTQAIVVTQRCTTDTDYLCETCANCASGTQCVGSGEGKTCSTCPTGKYRDVVGNFDTMYCLDCRSCNLANREYRTKCGPVSNSACLQCGQGHIVTTSSGSTTTLDTCTVCNTPASPTGLYANAASNTCERCKDCSRLEAETTACTAATNRACVACPTNQRASALNGQCDGCVAGYVRGASGCGLCSQAACGSNQYIKCTTSADLMGGRDCMYCQGHNHASSTKCLAGYGVSTFCAGDKLEAIACTACAAGTERPDGTAMVANAGNTVQIQQCKACATGKYKVGAGAGDCQACTNKPGINSVYVAWTVTAGSSVCPWFVLFVCVCDG